MVVPSWFVRLAPLAVLGLGLGCFFQAVPHRPGPSEVLFVGALWAALAQALHTSVALLFRRWGWLGWGAAGVGGVVVALPWRLDAEVLTGPVPFALASLSAAGWFGAVGMASARSRAGVAWRLREVVPPLAWGGVVLAAALGGFARPELRWSLLRHQRTFGRPLYALLSDPLVEVRDGLWKAHAPLADPWAVAERVRPAPPDPPPGAPHVVVVLVDTLRADALEPWGGERDWMPRLNALAAQSVVLGDVQANASWTRASCASLFTGLLPEEHGASRFHERLAEAWTTLPELLDQAGYQTAAFVTNWVQVGKSTGFAQGFGRFEELSTAAEVLARGSSQIRDQYARAAEVNAAAAAWLSGPERRAAAREGRPLFLYLHYLDPHSPYLSGVEPGNEEDPRERKRGLYRQELRYLDGQLGPFLERLDELLPGPMAIIVTSDHGEEFWEHGEWGHGHSLYRELTHVPAFVHLRSADGHPLARGRSDAPLELRDLFGLVRELASGIELDVRGWAEAHARATRYASQYLDRVGDARPDKKWTGLRRIEEDGYELIWSAYGPTLELYDLQRDPLERSNLVGRRPQRTGRLLEGLERAVRFWTRSIEVERSAGDLEFLRQLGYIGGVDN